MIPRVKGTQDFTDLTLFNFVIEAARKHLANYRFAEVQTPIVEHLDLFNRSLGIYTEVVSKEMFVIEPKHEGDEDRICLRPEGTAPLVRLFNEQHIQKLPWKVFMCGPMFRYERPQKGRYRQFNQITVEVIGSASVSEDVHCIAMFDRFFHEILGLNNFSLLVNFLGCFNDRKLYTALLKDFLEGPRAAGICQQCVERKDRNVLRIFDCKNAECQIIYRSAPEIAENLCNECALEWKQVQNELALLSISHIYTPTLVRGLDYYSKTVFEFTSPNLGAQAAFCGGGRYNQLVEQLGGKTDQAAVGAAIGIERLMLLLEPMKDQLSLPQPPALHIIIPLEKAQHALALLVADMLLAHSICTDVLFEGSVKSMMRKANHLGAAYVLVIGESEQQSKTVMLKNMVTGESRSVKQVDLVAELGGKK
jgi:histidyl-tRNA synthetase